LYIDTESGSGIFMCHLAYRTVI